MNDRVVGLRARTAPLSNGAEPEVIEALERLLEDARRGVIVAFAAVLVRPNSEIGTCIRNPCAKMHQLTAGTVYMQADLTTLSLKG